MSVFRSVALGFVCLLGVVGCKKIPADPVPSGSSPTVPCIDQTLGGFPRYVPVKQERQRLLPTYFICRPGEYAMEFDPNVRLPRWTTQIIDPAQWSGQPAKRYNDLRPDPLLPVGVSPRPDHWDNSPYGFLQLVPASFFDSNVVGISHTFYTSTIIPFDERAFEASSRLTENIKRWAEERGPLVVVSGPILEAAKPLAWIGPDPQDTRIKKTPQQQGKMAVPSFFFRVIVDPKTGQSMAFVLANGPLPVGQLPARQVSLAQIEQWAGLSLFPLLDPQSAAKVKESPPARWGLR